MLASANWQTLGILLPWFFHKVMQLPSDPIRGQDQELTTASVCRTHLSVQGVLPDLLQADQKKERERGKLRLNGITHRLLQIICFVSKPKSPLPQMTSSHPKRHVPFIRNIEGRLSNTLRPGS